MTLADEEEILRCAQDDSGRELDDGLYSPWMRPGHSDNHVNIAFAFEWRRFMTDHLKFGLTSMNAGATSYPEALVRVAQAAETAGFDSLWAGEHHVIATSSSRIPATTRYLNPVVALTFVAAHTRTVRLGTGVLLLPQHHPLILAKELASLDVLSGGRLMVGIGVGWAEAEFEALGVPYRERGARADEYLAAMRAIWSEERPAYHGRYVSFKDVQAFPHPVQQPTPPIIVGGRAPAVLRRTVEQANGWYGFALDVDETANALAELREAARRYHRPASLGELEISVAPRVPIDKEMAQRFAQLGVHRLILIPPPGRDGPALEQWVKSVGETLVGQV
jgi:probable F420-dependent oxidoreductase